MFRALSNHEASSRKLLLKSGRDAEKLDVPLSQRAVVSVSFDSNVDTEVARTSQLDHLGTHEVRVTCCDPRKCLQG